MASLNAFAPIIWTSKLFTRLRANLVHASTVNRDYEGEIRGAGDRVVIVELEPVATSTYSKNTDISWGNSGSYEKELLIDQSLYYARNLDAIDRVQSKVNVLNAIVDEAAYGMAKDVDTDLATLYSEAGNSVSAATVSEGSILLNISNMQYELDNANVPVTERFFPIQPWYHRDLVQAATGAVGNTTVPKVFSDGLLVNGYVGRLFGFNLLLSTQAAGGGNTTSYNMAYHRSAITFASQLSDFKVVDREARNGIGIKAFLYYGRKVVRPEAMVACTVTIG